MSQSLQLATEIFRKSGAEFSENDVPEKQTGDFIFPSFQGIGTVARFTSNETIFAEGDKADSAYKVITGAVRLCKILSDGRRQITEFLLEGDYFGLEWNEEHGLTAEALCDTALMRCPRLRTERLGWDRPEVQKCLISMLRHDLHAAQQHLIMLGRQTAKERVASFLLQLAGRQGAPPGSKLEIPMGRRDIADYLGLTIETVSRVVGTLKRAHIIAVPNRYQIILRNVSALRTVAMIDD